MSLDLFKSYESDFNQCLDQLKSMVDGADSKMISSRNPYEYEQAQNYLKQMEIESMNLMDAQGVEGDLIRQRI